MRCSLALAGALALLISSAASTLIFAGWTGPETALSRELGEEVRGMLIRRKSPEDLPRVLAAIRRLPDPERRSRALYGAGWGLARAFEIHESLPRIEAQLAQAPATERRELLDGIQFAAAVRRNSLRKRGDSISLRRASGLQELWERAAAQLQALQAGEPVSLVLVTLDTTRVDHLSTYGYPRPTSPSLDALARSGVRFDRAWSTSAWTLPAHASLFTGLYPRSHGARFDPGGSELSRVIGMPVAEWLRAGRLAEEHHTLAELLAGAGYATGAFVGGPWLHRSFGLLQGFQRLDDAVSGFAGRPARELTDAALAWLDGVAAGSPFLLFVNYFDPHMPYDPPAEAAVAASGRAFASGSFELPFDAVLRGEHKLGGEERAALVDRYDGEIRAMDEQLGRLLEAVDRRGAPTLVIVTADHGEALGEAGRLGHTYWLSEEIVRIPLVIRYPDGRNAGGRDPTPVQLVDLLPLVASELSLTLPAPVEGVPLGERHTAFAELYREPTAVLRFGERFDRDLRAAIEWPWKRLRSTGSPSSLLRLSESDLSESPAGAVAPAARLDASLDEHGRGRPVRVAPARADEEMREALRQLGYLH